MQYPEDLGQVVWLKWWDLSNRLSIVPLQDKVASSDSQSAPTLADGFCLLNCLKSVSQVETQDRKQWPWWEAHSLVTLPGSITFA